MSGVQEAKLLISDDLQIVIGDTVLDSMEKVSNMVNEDISAESDVPLIESGNTRTLCCCDVTASCLCSIVVAFSLLFIPAIIVSSVRGINWVLILGYTLWLYIMIASVVIIPVVYYDPDPNDARKPILTQYAIAIVINTIMVPVILFLPPNKYLLDFPLPWMGMIIDIIAVVALVAVLRMITMIAQYYLHRRSSNATNSVK